MTAVSQMICQYIVKITQDKLNYNILVYAITVCIFNVGEKKLPAFTDPLFFFGTTTPLHPIDLTSYYSSPNTPTSMHEQAYACTRMFLIPQKIGQ